MQILDLLRIPAKTKQQFVRTNAVYRVVEMFSLNGVKALENGSLTATSSEEQSTRRDATSDVARREA